MGIVQCHLGLFVGVLVVHVVNHVHGVHILVCKPREQRLVARHHVFVIECAVSGQIGHRGDLLAADFFATAVEGHQQGLREVDTSAEELHILTEGHCRDAASDSVVIAITFTHQVVVFVLHRVGLDGDVSAVILPTLRQALSPKHGHVRFRCGAEVFEGVEHTEGGLRHERTAVQAHTAERFGGPGGVTGEEVVVLRGTELTVHAQVEHVIVDEFLSAFFGEDASVDITLQVDVQEGCRTAERHGCTVLFLNGTEVTEIGCLHSFASGFCGLGDVATVVFGHLLQALQEVDLTPHVFTQTDAFVGHRFARTVTDGIQVLLLFFDEAVDTVESHTAIVTDDTTTAVCVRQTGQHVRATEGAHFLGVSTEHTFVVRRAVLHLLHHVVADLVTISFCSLMAHAHTAERVHRTLQRSIRLKTDDQFIFLVEVTGLVVKKTGNVVHIHVENAALFVFFLVEAFILSINLLSTSRRTGEEGSIAFIRRVVGLNEVSDINRVLPLTGLERRVLRHNELPL